MLALWDKVRRDPVGGGLIVAAIVAGLQGLVAAVPSARGWLGGIPAWLFQSVPTPLIVLTYLVVVSVFFAVAWRRSRISRGSRVDTLRTFDLEMAQAAERGIQLMPDYTNMRGYWASATQIEVTVGVTLRNRWVDALTLISWGGKANVDGKDYKLDPPLEQPLPVNPLEARGLVCSFNWTGSAERTRAVAQTDQLRPIHAWLPGRTTPDIRRRSLRALARRGSAEACTSLRTCGTRRVARRWPARPARRRVVHPNRPTREAACAPLGYQQVHPYRAPF